MIKFKKKRKEESFLHEVISDAQFDQFDMSQMQGKFSVDISKKYFTLISIIVFLLIISLFLRIAYLQVTLGEEFKSISENNTFSESIIFAERGVIYDRFENPLVDNLLLEEDYSVRDYSGEGFGQLLGLVNYPAKDDSGVYYQETIEGLSGVERLFNSKLKGRNGSLIIERDASQNIITEHFAERAIAGENIILSIDKRLQEKMFSLIRDNVTKGDFRAGAGVFMDSETGEILSLVSFPDFNPTAFSKRDINLIREYVESSDSIFLHRAISGLYTPGSTIKPFFALAALEEEVISPDRYLLSKGFIEIPNPFVEGESSIFRDWKIHGYINLVEALAVSSNEYFYHIGGGFGDIEGLGINKLNTYSEIFGFGEPTKTKLYYEPSGVIPNIEWKERVFNDDWRLGDTYNTVIGQYGFLITPLQLTRATASIANSGLLVEPHLLANETGDITKLLFDNDSFDLVKQGMRQAVVSGTAKALDVSYVDVSAKTGTAQANSKGNINSLITGFFPFDNPKYIFTIVLEFGDGSDQNTATLISRQLLDWMHINTPEYFTF